MEHQSILGFRWRHLAAAAGVVALFIQTASADDARLRAEALEEFGILAPVVVEALKQPEVTLGQALYWDARLSADGRTACASCHLPADWGADRRRFSPDARGKNTARNSQTVFNSTLQPALRWTGDRKSAAHQAEKSLTGSMGFASADDVVPLLMHHGYEASFRAAFPQSPDPVSRTNYARAIQAYEETLVTPAPFDRFLSGDNDALTAQQKSGLRAFLSANCADCHSGTLLGGRLLRKFGVKKDYWNATRSEKIDAGLFESTQLESDRYRFRVSMLRNIAKTGPYFHDGSVAKLKEAVQVMAEVQSGQRLIAADAADIVAFLESLTGEIPAHYQPPESSR